MRLLAHTSPARKPLWSALAMALVALLLIACQPAVKTATLAARPATGTPEAGRETPPTPTAPATEADAGGANADPAQAMPEEAEPAPPNTPTAAAGQDAQAGSPTTGKLPTPTSALIPNHTLPPEAWKSWPVVPQVPEGARQIYQQGLALGNDPHAFSILGDCQSLAETFLGVYDTEPEVAASLPPELRATVAHFAGSFDRSSPTIKGGTTAGAILWNAWHENTYSCSAAESPLACELRLHKPSIVIINLGTHYETRNIRYVRMILDELIAQGIVPILSTKADNRELDERLNMEMALLAVEYNLPLWNFYAAVDDLPDNGVGVKEGEEHLGEIYLSEKGLERHRYTALQALTAVWLAVQQP